MNGREGQSGETSTHDDDDDNDDVFEEDSYHRQVEEIQKKAISRFPAGCRTKSCRFKLQGRSSQAFQERLYENGSSNKRLNQKPLKTKKSNDQQSQPRVS